VKKELELWQFVAQRLEHGERAVLLVVGDSSGSSPGRPGYRMAVGSDGELCGSIGGGVMEINIVERSRALLSEPEAIASSPGHPQLIEQVHQNNSPHASGMICSGRQSVILVPLASEDLPAVQTIIEAIERRRPMCVSISQNGLSAANAMEERALIHFDKKADTEFIYKECLDQTQWLYIIGGGHCSLALSELMSRLDFRISIFDDRPDLNTIEKNRFAHEIQIINSYENIGDLVTEGPRVYVVIMTIGYDSDEIAIRSLIKKEIKYLGVLGSRAKMKVLLNTLEKEGIDAALLSRIRTPIGLPINSHSPEEIAVSIAAEIISVKNA
jgi:xanthine dehydrogenase accessory factor